MMSTVYQILNNYGWFRLTAGLKEKPNCSIFVTHVINVFNNGIVNRLRK